MKSYQIREQAKTYLTGGWKTFAITTFIYLLLLLIFSYGPVFFNAPYLLSILLQSFINTILTYGLLSSFWNYSKGKDVKFYDFIIISFKNIKRSLLLFFHTAIRLAIPFLLTILSTILLGGSISGFNIYQLTSAETSPLLIVIIIISILLFILTYAFFFLKSLNYAVSTLIAIDQPDLNEKDCILKSKELMVGNRKKYIFLLLSFIGWFIVGIFTLLIGFLWIFPYLQMSLICFYEMLKDDGNKNNKKSKKKNKKKK